MKTRLTLHIAAILLCGASLFCSVGLWVSEQQSVLAMVLAGIIAGALELCKFSFFPLATKLNWLAASGLYSLATLLLILSIGATVAFLESGANHNINQARTSSAVYQSAKTTLDSIKREIHTLQKLMDADLENGYRKRALSQSKNLEALRTKEEQALEKLNGVVTTPESGIHSIFNTLAGQLNVSVPGIRITVYLIAAVTVDVCGIVCLLLLSTTVTSSVSKTVTDTVSPSVTDTETFSDSGTVTNTVTKQPITVTANESAGFGAFTPSVTTTVTPCVTETVTASVTKQCNTEQHETIKRNVTNGVYGNKPAMRDIIKKEKIRHPDIKTIFDELVNECVLAKAGKGFQLVGAE